MKTILVTGGTGLVGSAIRQVISEELTDVEIIKDYRCIFLSSKDGNLIIREDVKRIFEIYKPTYVIHLAASVGGLYKNLNNNLKMYLDNLKINQNILYFCDKYKVKKIVSCLSTCVFPNKVKYPINESMLHEGLPHSSNEGYAFAKRMLEVESRLYNNVSETKYICIIPTNVYGPNDNYSLNDGHVIPSLIHRCYLAKENGNDFVVYGSGKPLRQFIYSIDLGKLILLILDKYDDREGIILASNKEYSIKEISELICINFNYSNIVFDRSKSDGQYKKTASNEKLLKLYPEFKFTSLEEGLKETISWFIKEYPNIRR
tara:strand:- start:1529 stop:2479 length:951 start_codon:yes stop_codon:yes gene_type:complete